MIPNFRNLLYADEISSRRKLLLVKVQAMPRGGSNLIALAQEGVEPSSLDNDSKMLPLHYRAINNALYSGEAQSPTPMSFP